MSFSQIEQGTGELISYPDVYKDVTDEDIKLAKALEEGFLKHKASIEQSFLTMGRYLVAIRDRKAYLALNYPSFSLWCQSPGIDIGYRQAHDLIRITEELVPRLEAANVPALDSVSKMRELLPLISEGHDVAEAAELVRDLTVQDTKATLKDIRGIEDKQEPTVFKAYVTPGPNFNTVKVVCYDEHAVYTAGTLQIKPEHMARWTSRFGRFIEYE